jgi:lipoyl(octanoyl) transferase
MSVWRMIEDGPGEAAWNMGVDEAIAEACRREHAPPTLRFYTWEKPALTIGYFQKWDRNINHNVCDKEGTPVVRRITGGRGVIHGDDLTYCVSAGSRVAELPNTIRETYLVISRAIVHGLRQLGVYADTASASSGYSAPSPVCFLSVSRQEVVCHGRKIIGSAQRRWKDGMLQQGSVLLCNNPEAYHRFFYSPDRRHPDQIVQDCQNRIAGLDEFIPTGVLPQTIIDQIANGFEKVLGITFKRGELTPLERRRAEELTLRKYSAVSWNRFRIA